MRRQLLALTALALLASACNSTRTGAPPTPSPGAAATSRVAPTSSAVSATPVAAATAAPATVAAATTTPTRTPTVTATAPTATASPEFHLSAADVFFHPEPQLYSGDVVSFEVVAGDVPRAWEGATVTVYAGSVSGPQLAAGQLDRFGLAGRTQATLMWVWDTSGLTGPQTLVVVAAPAATPAAGSGAPPSQAVTVTVNLLPADQRPPPEPTARWAQSESECCLFHYLTGTAAARDIDLIEAQADAAFDHVESVLGVQRQQKVSFTLLSRLLGHGGFAAREISLTHIDRNPALGLPFTVFAHEATHVLDRQLSEHHPALLAEGLAVYVAGGHFKPEDLDRRAAALLALGRYIPLAELADGFYPAQHEVGYLEGGAFVHYLVKRFGWDAFTGMLAAFQPAPSDAAMVDAGLQANFGLSLAEVEADWLKQLRAVPRDEAEIDDLRLTIDLFDTLRRYQQLKDPAAFFLTAWLADAPAARERGIVADFVRHPTALDNITLETMMAAAGRAMQAGEYSQASRLLTSVNTALDHDDLGASPLAADYAAVVAELMAVGYEPQVVRLDGNAAHVTAIRHWPTLDTLELIRGANGWRLVTAVSAGRRGVSPCLAEQGLACSEPPWQYPTDRAAIVSLQSR